MIRTAPSAGRATRVLVALVLAVPLLGARNVTGRHASQQETDGSTVSDITLTLYSGQEAQDVAAGKRSMTPLPTAGGVVHVDYIYSAVSDDPDATWVVGYAPGEETVQWAVEIAEGAWYRDVESSPQSSVIGRTENSSSGPQAVSPDGRHLSVLVQPSSMEDVDTVAEQRSLVVVLDAATGRTVRTVEISGLVLGQTLTDDTLAVQTAQDYFPAGDGQTAVTVYPLDFPDAEATSFPTDQWLVGAGDDCLLLSPWALPEHGDHGQGSITVTRTGTDGTAMDTISGVGDVYRGGWVEQYVDPAAAVDVVTQPGLEDSGRREGAPAAARRRRFRGDAGTSPA